jgi:periplasmic protein TonB
MRKIHCFIIIVFCCLNKIAAQNAQPIKDSFADKFQKVEIESEFKGGSREWAKFLQKNLNANIPNDNKAKKGKYTVVVKFEIDVDGTVSNMLATTKHGYGMEKEVMRVIALATQWTPAIQNGKPVRAVKMQPVTFLVE